MNRQLKQELICLRKRAALKPGFDPLRNCARCLTELGRILNRGALCPVCLKKVCKDCRHYGDENHEWLCIYCYKQMQLKAISGEWMFEFSRLSIQNRAKDSPGDELRKVLHDTQRRGMLSNEVTETVFPQLPNDDPPEKPPRIFTYEPPSPNASLVEEIQVHLQVEENKTDSTDLCVEKASPEPQKDIHQSSPKLLPRISPWSDIDPEPTLPPRIDKTRPVGGIQQFESLSFKERQSSDEGHSTGGYRSRSVSSEVMDESEPHVPVPLPRKRIIPLKKQQAIPDKNSVDNQQSSVDTTDSGVCSPVLKTDFSLDTNPASPLAVSRLSSNEQESIDSPTFAHCLASESSLSEDDDRRPQIKISGNFFRKRKSAHSRSAEDKCSATSAETRLMPALGLSHSFTHYNVYSNPLDNTNFKQQLIGSYLNFSNFSRSDSYADACCKNTKHILTRSNFHLNSRACALHCSIEARGSGSKNDMLKNSQLDESAVYTKQLSEEHNGIKSKRRDRRKKYLLQLPHLKRKRGRKKDHICSTMQQKTGDSSKSSTELKSTAYSKSQSCININSLNAHAEFKKCSDTICPNRDEKSRSTLVRSASLPSNKTFSEDWLKPWLWKCHSLEDWLWYLEEQPYQSRNFSEISNMLPDDYKLVYVSSSSSDSDEPATVLDLLIDCQSKFSSKTHLKVNSHMKINYGTSYIEDSDWELESEDSAESDSITNCKTGSKINEANNFLINYVPHIDEKSIRDIRGSPCDNLALNFNKSSESHHTFQSYIPVIYSANIPLIDFRFLSKKHRSFHEHALRKKLQSNIKIQSCRSHSGYGERKIVESLEESSTLIFKENIPSWPSFSSERPNSLLLSALCCSFENNDGEKPDFVLDQSHCFRTNLHKQLIHETVLVISSQAVSDLFSQYLKHISKPYFEIIFSQHNSPHDSEFYSLFSDSSKVVSIFANNLNSLSFPRVISDNILFSRSLIQLNKLLSPPNVNITHDSLFTLCNENSTVPFQFKFITERDSYILIFAPRVYTRNKFKSVNKNVFSHAFVHLNTSTNSLSEFYNVFKECFESRTSRSDMFHSVSWWRDCCEEKVGNWLQLDDANAFHYTAFPLSSYSTNRGNDNSATGWGKLRCCIAVATQRVIDLNPRALVCGREVLDSADLTSYLRWEAGTDDKLGKSENLVNAFLYRNPPVFQIPEADYLFCLTRSELCVLFQRSLHARVEIRMIAAKFGVTGVSAFDKTDHDSKLSPNKTEKNCEEMQSERTENFSQNGNHQFAVDSTWINTNEEIFSIHCQSRISDGGSRKNVNKQETSLLRWNAVDSVDYDKCSLHKQTIGSTNNDASCYKFNLQMKDSVKELPHDDCVAPGAENLLCIENTFDSELNEEYRNCDHSAVKVHSVVSDYSDSNERVDCQCNKPCEVPLSPSVVDATVERSIIDDGEILSSGDELDKFESDTDSQDTVIEGEAYKRIRSVAIKEKILHANEELFGTNSKETFYSYSSGAFNDNPVINRNENSKPQVKMCSIDEIRSKISPQSFLQTHYQNDIPELPIFSDSEESDSPTVFSSLEKHFLSFKKQNLSTSHSASSAFSELKSEDSCNSSFYPSFNETTCSSESSDNGSDGEEVILSDTSTSSDEATYIAPASGFQYYSHPVSYKLHTIAEESCEESERSSRNSLPLSKSCSDFEYYDKTRLSLAKNPRKTHRKLIPDSPILAPNTEFKSGKGSAVYAVLATSRLEKYFKSSLQDGDKVSYPDDDMTDESGEVSSEEDLASDRLINQMIVGKKIENFYKSPKLPSSSDWCIAAGKYNRLGSPSSIKSSNTESKMRQHVEIRKEFDFGSPVPKSEHNTSELKRNKVNDQVPDDEAKYIMNHLMQHITNNSDIRQENTSEIKDMSPMLKILESEIARLMLTVSPASLSTGEPSSSCSSTIGSNNSDYGSDTLESAEESTSEEEINAEIAPENRPDGDAPEQIDSFSASTSNETVASDNVPSDFAPSCGDPVVSEETLYICKQLMASLKKIADSTEGAYASDDLCAGAEDHTAKQYITDQIVSLMQTVNASHNSSPLLRRLSSNPSAIQIDSDISQDHSDSDSPPPNDDKREHSKSKTPSESGSETTISASISIPSYDDSDRTPTESEISHEMDELYALLESSSASQDMINSAKFSYDFDNHSLDKSVTSRNADSPLSEEDINFSFTESSDVNPNSAESGSSLLYGAASKLESLLPITIEERIARYKDAFLNKIVDNKDLEVKAPEMRINVILPQPSVSENITDDIPTNSTSLPSDFDPIFNTKSSEKLSTVKSCEDIVSCCIHKVKSEETSYNITSVKIISHNTYPPSSAIHKILSNNIDSTYLDHQKHDSNIVNICDASSCKASTSNEILMGDDTSINDSNADQCTEESESTILSPLPKVINPKEKASSENDLLVANYRTKYKGNKVFGTKSVGNICELENISNKSTFRDTGYYSFKSSEESFLSLDDSTASQTSTASLTQYRSLTSTETIPEEEESCAKGTASTKMSLSSSNIPDAVCDNSPSKSSTLPLSLRNKLSSTSNSNHRTRSSFFSTSGVLRKLTLLRDESGNSLRSSPHNRYNPRRNRSSSGGSEDGKQKKATPHKHESLESQSGRLSAASSEKDSSGIQDEDIDQHLSFTTRSQMSLSSFGGRSESVTSVYSAAGGRRYGTVIVTGDVLFGLNYCYKVGVLEVNIKECRNLAAVDTKKNRSDPYVKVYLLPDRTKSGKRKTKVKKHTLNPVFDELLKFQVTVSELEIRTLWLSVWHSDRFGRNDFLGEVMLPLGNDTFENSGLKWYPLQERLETLDPPVSYKGDLILALKYVPPDVTSRRFSKKPGIPAKGALEVLVREARNLMATRSNGTSDPFCKSYLLPDKSKAGKQKTPVFKKSCNPKWNHTFVYDDVSLDDLRERCLELTIWDYDKITSNDFLGGVRLCLGTGKYQGREVDWMDSVGEERSLWYTMLDRPNTWVDGSLLLRCNMQSRRIV